MVSFNFSYLESSGFNEYVLPFFVVFILCYSVFNFMRRNAKKNKGNFVMDSRTVVALSVIIGFISIANRDLRDFISDGIILFFALIVLMFLIMIFKAFSKEDSKPGTETDWMPIMLILISIVIIVGTIGMPNMERMIGINAENIFWAGGILVFIILLWGAHKQAKPDSSNTQLQKNVKYYPQMLT